MPEPEPPPEEAPPDGGDEAAGEGEEEGYYIEDAAEECEAEMEEPFVSIFDILDAPRELQEPIPMTQEHMMDMQRKLGLIRLCWPDIEQPFFEGKVKFPETYTSNSNKEKLLLLYCENFRRQFVKVHPTRRPLFLTAPNVVGLMKMVCTTLRPTTLPYPEIETWQDCASFVGDQILYEPLEEPTHLPKRLYSPHTMFLRQSGQCFEIATGLCSLLLGLGYDTYVVSGFATEDICKRIMKRVECPFPPEKEEEVVEVKREIDAKYVLKPPTDLRSKFLLAMEQRELDKIKAEKQRIADEEVKQREEEERPPDDELHGARRHSWVLLLAGERDIQTSMFIEPSTGVAYPLDCPFYLGIDSLWNNTNYWINLQDCSHGLGNLGYDFSNLNHWEHLLMGEPTKWRDRKVSQDMEDDEVELLKLMEEKHLDIPSPWSLRISIPHEVLKNRFPGGTKITHYLRTMVHQYAPYVQSDGLVLKICRHTDMECLADELQTIEERYANRMDNMLKIIIDVKDQTIAHYFKRGREDSVKLHTYFAGTENDVEAVRSLEFYHQGRHDGLQKLELGPQHLTEFYVQREDRLYYRHTTFAVRGRPPPGIVEGLRRIVVNIVEKFRRNERIPASKDVAIREYAIVEREVHLKYHYEEGKVTASTRDFIKPSIEEMGEKLKFHPHLTTGYQAEIGGKPPRSLELFLLLKQQLEDEDKALHQIRDVEDQVSEFLKLRALEVFQPVLKVSLFDREENKQYEQGLREREQKEKETKEREVEDEIDYLAPFINRLGNPKKLSYAQAKAVVEWCREEFKTMLVNRANDVQQQFERQSHLLQERHDWYVSVQDTLSYEEEMEYYEEVNNMTFILHSLELRLSRHRDLSPYRWEALDAYLKMDTRLSALYRK